MTVDVDRVSVRIGGREILKEITLSLGKGELISLLGPNGSGKSTLMKTIYGIVKPASGGVYVDGENVHVIERAEIAKRLGYLPQESPTANLRVVDVVVFGRIPYSRFSPSREDYSKAINALSLVGMEDYSDRNFAELSGGEKQKTLLARVFCQETDYLLLDEPTSHLDLKSQVEIMKIAKRLASRGKGVLMAMHDINLAGMFSDKVILIKDGEVVEEGSVSKVLKPDTIEEVYGIRVEVVKFNGNFVVIPVVE